MRGTHTDNFILFFYFINKLHHAEFHHQSVKCNIVSKFISEMVEFGKVSSKSDTRRKNAIGITQIFFVGVLTLISFLLCIYNSIKLN